MSMKPVSADEILSAAKVMAGAIGVSSSWVAARAGYLGGWEVAGLSSALSFATRLTQGGFGHAPALFRTGDEEAARVTRP
jgi:hypothetical protein